MQKVICIDDSIYFDKDILYLPSPNRLSKNSLTINKVYEVLTTFSESYIVIGDDKKLLSASKKRFTTIEEYRELTLNKLLK